MEKQTRIAIYGSSLNMASIAASLSAEANLDVVCINPHSPAAYQDLQEIEPAAIAFDLSDPSTSLDASLLRAMPGVLLIGLDPSSDELMVVSSRLAPALSVADLVQVIRSRQMNQEQA